MTYIASQPQDQRRAYPSVAAFFTYFVPFLTEAARQHGYALAVHGSMATDLDLIAVPWTLDAHEPEALVEALRTVVGGSIPHNPDAEQWDEIHRNPVDRPHGRRVWTIYLGHDYAGPYIDLGVMPRL